jgi:prolyl 4-hydroxylase
MTEPEFSRRLNAGDARQAIARLEAAAAKGDAASFVELGVWYLEGRHVARDLRQSRECFRKAGELGNPTAEHVYICFLANGVGGEADWQAAKWHVQKLAATDPKAARQLELVEAMALDARGFPLVKPASCQLSMSPAIWTLDCFASAAECLYLIETAEPLLAQSSVVDPNTGKLRPHPVRTSEGAMFPWASEDLVISALNRRIAAASGTEAACGEPLQVLRYLPGQQYRPHLDALPNTDNQRILTMLVYLNEGYSGGETFFTRTGLKFAGKTGDGLLFRNAGPGGHPDPNAQHAGLPVLRGEKFIASRWIREQPLMAH